MNLLTIATEWLKARWQESAIGMLCLLVVALYWPLENWLLFHVGTLPTVWLLRTGLAMLLVTLVSVTYALYLHPRLEFLRECGVYRDRKTGIFYCLSCLTRERLRSPLREEEDGWRCMVMGCHMFYPNRPVIADSRKREMEWRDRVKKLEKEVTDLKTPKGPQTIIVRR